MDVVSYLLGKNASGGGGGNLKISPISISFREVTDDIIHTELLDTSKITTFYNLFYRCFNLKNLDLSGFDITKVESFQSMFQQCGVLGVMTELDLSSFGETVANSCNSMFYMCFTLKKINLCNFTPKYNMVTNSMFYGCTALEEIDMRNFDFSKVSGYNQMFGTTGQYVPDNCLIIVKDDTQKQWLNTNFSFLTNVKTVAEL